MYKADALTMPQRSELDAATGRSSSDVFRWFPPTWRRRSNLRCSGPSHLTGSTDRRECRGVQHLLAPLNDVLARPGANQTVISALMGGFNRQIVSAEMGMLVGYLARRVLGQYELALISGEPTGPGNLYFVEPNIAATEHLLGLPKDQPRLWLALHEPRMCSSSKASLGGPYFQSLLDEYFVFLKSDLGEFRHGLNGARAWSNAFGTDRAST